MHCSHSRLRAVALLAATTLALIFAASAQANVVTSFSNQIGSGRFETQDVGLAMFANATPGQAVPITVRNVNEPGTMTLSRVDLESTVKETLTTSPFPWTPGTTSDVSRSFTLHVPSGGSGWDELRWHSEFKHDSTRERTFNTTRHCIHYSSGTGNYCGGPTVRGRCGGGSWYESALYNVSFIDCRDLKAIMDGHPPSSIRVKFQVDYSGGGYGVIARDPNGGGQVGGHYAANTWITIPNPGGTFWLLSVANNGQDGGYQVVQGAQTAPVANVTADAGATTFTSGTAARSFADARADVATPPTNWPCDASRPCAYLDWYPPPAGTFMACGIAPSCWNVYSFEYTSAPGHDFGAGVNGPTPGEPESGAWIETLDCNSVAQGGVAYYWFVSSDHWTLYDPAWTDSFGADHQGPAFLAFGNCGT
jgi:hypothetical protein